MSKLPRSFYLRNDVFQIARELLGKILLTEYKGVLTSGIITETEAYNGVVDSASHAYRGRRTPRNETMYANGGTAYVYFCYGIHRLFNVVTSQEGVPHAVLIRAVEPIEGINSMMKRRNLKNPFYTVTRGPGSLSKALGIQVKDDGCDLLGGRIWIEDSGIVFPEKRVRRTKRIGVESAGKDANRLYRFIVADNPWITPSPFNRG